jgi:hypothetical protein
LTSYLILSPLHTGPGPRPGALRILSKRKIPPFRKDASHCTCHSLFWSAANQGKRTFRTIILLKLSRNCGEEMN